MENQFHERIRRVMLSADVVAMLRNLIQMTSSRRLLMGTDSNARVDLVTVLDSPEHEFASITTVNANIRNRLDTPDANLLWLTFSGKSNRILSWSYTARHLRCKCNIVFGISRDRTEHSQRLGRFPFKSELAEYCNISIEKLKVVRIQINYSHFPY